ncbi:MAG TPA: M13-type metalloendopeptidase [Nocardioides sp.]|uniref:M13 family metallopeptidase n=1 Tax=Nocardioides sp. TaxID=35761 RepID=UPI002E32EA0B|nr:M13-type metalloendopeptidase [Nocardioides sp.]HEX3929837.1 M13-type metalloendopeptidase [Nocardioides sp.]
MSTLDDAREGMDLSVRPQDDLFGHVNGRWLETVVIPDDKGGWGPFMMLADAAEAQVRVIIEELAEDVAEGRRGLDGDPARIAHLYASFMDEATVDALGTQPIQPLLDAVAGLRDVRDLAAFLGELEQVGGSGAFGVYVDTDAKDSERSLLNLVQGGLGLPDESYYRDEKFAEIREKYAAFLTTMFGLVGRADAAADAATVLALETRLAQGHWERAATRDVDKTYNLLTRAELEALCPAFDWEAFVRNLGGPVESIAEVCVRQPSYLEHLSTALAEVPIEQWQVWLTLRVVRMAAPYLPAAFVEANFDFYGRTLSGTPQLRERWKRAVAVVEGSVGEAVGREYVTRHFPPESKAMMEELVGNLLRAYRESISKLDWMSEETKQRAYAKLDMFRSKIGYPDEFRDYSELAFSPVDLLGNVLSANAFETRRQLAKIGSPVDRGEWLMLPQEVNAYYRPGMNEICFPAAILQRPFFSPEAEPSENYGGIGAVIGHEVGHGFDDQGAKYDGSGNLQDWWEPEDKERFRAKQQALIAQYDAFEPRALPGEHVNGELTVGENIGDLGGLTIALAAYVIARDGDVSTEDVKRLFLNWGFVWRTKRRKELDQQYLTIDPHSPPEFRANVVRNLDEFHTTFATEPGDGMWLDPEARVRIW